MTRLTIILLLAGCVAEDATDTDAGMPDQPRPALRVPENVPPPDAAVPDAPACWDHVYYQCLDEHTVTDVCVPETGCAFVTCDGQTYGYCGPGGGS